MSRSTKKPVWADRNPEMKVKANRKVRQKGKLALTDASHDIKDGKAYRRISNSYDIKDWSFYDPKSKKVRRK